MIIHDLRFIHSGSTMLNLSLTGHPLLGWPLGRVSNVVGDKSTGKTLLAIEAATLLLKRPPKGITKPRVVYFEGEAAFDQGYAEMLGMPVNDVIFESGENGEVATVEDVFDCAMDYCNNTRDKETATLMIVDSLDSISSEREKARDIRDEKTYGMEKTNKLSEAFRKLVQPMEDAQMHLMIISQVRDNITQLPFAPRYRRSGGKALDFYCSHVTWLAEIAKHKTLDWVYGIQIKANVTKNKVSRPYRKCEFPIIFEYGIDDIHSMITFLKDKRFSKEYRIDTSKGWWSWPRLDEKMKMEDLVDIVEEDREMYKALIKDAYTGWDWYEQQCTVDRLSKADLLGNITPEDVEIDDDHDQA